MYVFRGVVQRIGDRRVTDGDTINVEVMDPPVILQGHNHRGRVRLWGIDAPESHYLGKNQGQPAKDAYEFLASLLKNGEEVQIHTGVEPVDSHDRILGRVVRKDGLDVNIEILRNGFAAMYQIYPNLDRFNEYRAAFQEAIAKKRGLFASGEDFEYPFEFRMRIDGRLPDKYVGDSETGLYYQPLEYRLVPPPNRIFFFRSEDAARAGFEFRKESVMEETNRKLLAWLREHAPSGGP